MVKLTVTRPATHASAAFLWKKLAAYSAFDWHPLVADCQNTGNVPDGSADMVGAMRLVTSTSGAELKETATAWSDEERYLTFDIVSSAFPPPVDTFSLTFKIREDEEGRVFVDGIADVSIKPIFCLLTPILKMVLKKKVTAFVEGIAELNAKE